MVISWILDTLIKMWLTKGKEALLTSLYQIRASYQIIEVFESYEIICEAKFALRRTISLAYLSAHLESEGNSSP